MRQLLVESVVVGLLVAGCGGSSDEVDAGSPAGAFVGYDADGRLEVFDEGKPSTRIVAVRAATFVGNQIIGFAYPEDYVGVDVVRVEDDPTASFVSHLAIAGESIEIDRVASVATGRTTLATSDRGSHPIRYVLDDLRSPTPTLQRVPHDIVWLVPIPSVSSLVAG